MAKLRARTRQALRDIMGHLNEARKKSHEANFLLRVDRLELAVRELERDYRGNVRPDEVEDQRVFRLRNKFLNAIREALIRSSEDPNNDAYYNEVNEAIKNLHAFERKIVTRLGQIQKARTGAEYGSYFSMFMKYLNLAWFTFIQDLAIALKAIEAIFPPVTYAFIALKDLFDLTYKLFQMWGIKKSEKTLRERIELLESDLADAIVTFAKMTAFAMEVLAVVAFAGVLTATPVGLALVAAAGLAGWISDVVIPAWYKRRELKQADEKIDSLQHELENEKNDIQKIADLNERIVSLQERKKDLQKEYSTLRANVLWGAVAIVGLALVAAGPFGLAAVGIAGSIIVGVVAVRGIAVGVKAYYERKQKAVETAHVPQIKTLENEEFALSSNVKLQPTPKPVQKNILKEIEQQELKARNKNLQAASIAPVESKKIEPTEQSLLEKEYKLGLLDKEGDWQQSKLFKEIQPTITPELKKRTIEPSLSKLYKPGEKRFPGKSVEKTSTHSKIRTFFSQKKTENELKENKPASVKKSDVLKSTKTK